MRFHSKADVILSSHAVFTGLTNQPYHADIAIIENKIAAIGSKEEIIPYIGPDTKIYDFGNQLILPGFHDFHLHIMAGGLALNSVNLFAARSQAEAIQMVRKYAERNPGDSWIIGFKWDSGRWNDKQPPHRSALDVYFPDRPIVLFSLDSHYAWVNSKALEIAKISSESKDPDYGFIEKDLNGEPTGILVEGAISFVTKHAYDFSQTQKRQLLQRFLTEAARFGVTSVNNMFGSAATLDDYQMFQEFEKTGNLTTRIHLFPALDGDIKSAKRLRDTYSSKKLRVSGLKQFIDGVISNSTAFLIEPYSDNSSTETKLAHPPETIKRWVVEADQEGFSVRFHAIGDGAVRLALDAYETAKQVNGVRDSRHSVEHVEVIHPDDLPRFHDLGVIASMQPGLLANTERGLYTSRIGEDRAKYAFAIKTLQNAEATIAFGTDFPIDPLNPMHQIHKAVTRLDSSGKQEWNPNEAITLAEALKAYTYGSAYGTFREDELGTLEAGKLADLIVLDRNLFEISEEEIMETQVELTMVDGNIVFNRSNVDQDIKQR
ncbi:amidohydrolase [Bacillus sp. JJ1764]|uniref:amidohydrolase n=1 Tax=Bacillus sp. JJ1764 TaxID=3122964 RepID=UPI002FFF0D60